jgi:hypothetical protein
MFEEISNSECYLQKNFRNFSMTCVQPESVLIADGDGGEVE